MREFKIIRVNAAGELVTEFEMFTSAESACAWGDRQNNKNPGSIIDITLEDVNEEFKYEHY